MSLLQLSILLMLPVLFYVLSIVMLNKLVRERLSASVFKWSGVVGTTVHEFSHFVACVCCLMRVNKVVFYSPQDDGTLGFVSYSYNPRSLRHRISQVFIGFAPIYFGAGFTVILTYFMLDVSLLVYQYDGILPNLIYFLDVLVGSFVADWISGVIWLLLSFCILTHSLPSSQDIKGSSLGVVLLMVLMSLAVVCIYSFSGDTALQGGLVSAISVITLIVTSLTAISVLLLIAVIVLISFKLFLKAIIN